MGILQLIACCVLFCMVSQTKEEDHLSILRQITPTEGLWEPNWDDFNKYVVNGPRNYSILVLFLSESPDALCNLCPKVKSEFEKVATYYQSANSPNKRDLFFIVAEWTRNKVFAKYKHKLEVPMIVLVPPLDKSGPQFKWPTENKFTLTGQINAEGLALYYNKRLEGRKIPIPEPEGLHLFNYALLAVIIISLGRNVYQYRNEKNFWVVASMFVIWFSYTGTIWNLNRGPPFIHLNKDSFTVIWPQQRMQTILEGLLVASLLMVLATCVAVVGVHVPAMDPRDPDLQRKNFYMASSIFIICLMILHLCWLRKTPWYLMYSQ